MAAVATGTTSAHAENTWGQGHGYDRGGNYLRARGEYGLLRLPAAGLWELPPRTRRIRLTMVFPAGVRGTTSAHAENTDPWANMNAALRNYLRARGEYGAPATPTTSPPELPPRTRRIQGARP